MIDNVKALVVILGLAAFGFALIRPVCLAVMPAETYARRRNTWLLLTTVAFLSPSFAIYAVFATILIIRESRRDTNPLALYALLMFALPNTRFYIPTVLINNLFDLTHLRLLALVLLLPFIHRWFRIRNKSTEKAFTFPDAALLAYLFLQVALSIPNQSLTASMRQSFLLMLDGFLAFYAFSRLKGTKEISDVLASFFAAIFIMSLVGSFESIKGWLLYTGLSMQWGDPNVFAWLVRGDRLRAQASAGGPLGLGFDIAIALGCYLYLRPTQKRLLLDVAIITLMLFGLFVTSSRGPWLTCLLIIMVFLSLRPGAAGKMAGVAVGAAMIAGVLYLTPLKESVLDRLPIIGTADQDTVEYRQQLAELSWTLIRQHPFFGDPFVVEKMESLRQGQGIVDIVNGYLFTLLFTGWVGMILQGCVFLAALYQGFRAYLKSRAVNLEMGAVGAVLVACFLGCLFFIAVAGDGPVTYLVAGLLVSYAATLRQRSLVHRGGRISDGSSPNVPTQFGRRPASP